MKIYENRHDKFCMHIPLFELIFDAFCSRQCPLLVVSGLGSVWLAKLSVLCSSHVPALLDMLSSSSHRVQCCDSAMDRKRPS